MNALKFGARQRGRGRKRGVSPIIATILLVAITVVLAAVLYVLISGLTGSSASAPISLAPVVQQSGVGGSGSTWYVPVGLTPSASVATTAFGLKVQSSGGTILPVAAAVGGTCAVGGTYTAGSTCTGVTGFWYGVLTNASGKIVAIYLSAGWSSSVTVTGGAFTLNVISQIALDGQGYTLNAYGTGSASVSGSVTL